MEKQRLPIYLLIDCSDSMAGKPIDTVKQSINDLLDAMKNDPLSVASAWLSVIVFNNFARQVVPLTKLTDFSTPQLQTNGATDLNEAFRFLKDCIKREKFDDDWKPFVFLFTTDSSTNREIFSREVEQLQNSVDMVAFAAETYDKITSLPNFVIVNSGLFELGIGKFFSNEISKPVSLKKPSAETNQPPPIETPPAEVSQPPIEKPPVEKIQTVSNYARRLPVYLLLDCSGSMAGEPIDEMQKGVELLLDDLKGDPQALETVHLSVITFDNEARQSVSLTELMYFKMPKLRARGQTALGEALHVLKDCINREVRKNTAEHKGDWKPLVFLLTDGYPTDKDVFQKEIQDLGSLNAANIIACAAGARADTKFLKQITNNVLVMNNVSAGDMAAFFAWTTASLALMSEKISTGAPINLPPPPPNFTVVP